MFWAEAAANLLSSQSLESWLWTIGFDALYKYAIYVVYAPPS